LVSVAEERTESDSSRRPGAERDVGEEASSPPSTAHHGALAAFQNRPFLLFWSTLAPALTGVWVRITAQGYLVYDLTRDEFVLGLVSFCGAAPVLLASPIAGAVLDRVDRRRVLQIVQLIAAAMTLLMAILVATDRIAVWHVLILVSIIGFASGFDWPARLSIVPALVDRDRLKSAVALTAAAFNGSRIVGPGIGGIVAGTAGIAACLFLTAGLYLPFILVLIALPLAATAPAAAGAAKRGAAWRDLVEGYRYIWRTPTLRGLLSVDLFPLAFGMAYFTLAPAVARDILGLGEVGLGALLLVNGIGSLLGTVAVAMMGGVRRRGRVVVAGVGAFGVTLALFALAGTVYAAFLLIFFLGLITAIYGTFNDTLIQTYVDDAYRGRVLSVYSMFWGLTPIGGLIAGAMATVVGVQAALFINALLVLCYVPILLRFTPVSRID
jgi:MFS family permease